MTKPQSWDRFSYSYNNPIKYNDPSGHTACLDGNCGNGILDSLLNDFSVHNSDNDRPCLDGICTPDLRPEHNPTPTPHNPDINDQDDNLPMTSEEAANEFGPCFTCHANKESDHWLSYEEMQDLYHMMNRQEAIGYSILLAPMFVFFGKEVIALQSSYTTIGGIRYTSHALERMAERGISATVVETVLSNGNWIPSDIINRMRVTYYKLTVIYDVIDQVVVTTFGNPNIIP